MSLMTDKHAFLDSKKFYNAVENLSKDKAQFVESRKVEDQKTVVVPKEKEETKNELAEIEKLRKNHELLRRKSVKIAAGLLQVNDLIINLERIEKDRNKDHCLGFRSTKEIKPEDVLLGKIAQTISEVLKIYPSPSNMQVAMGFIEMVDLIDELEDMANDERGDRIGFSSSILEKTPLQAEALQYAENLRAKILYLMEWLEVPEYVIASNPSKN